MVTSLTFEDMHKEVLGKGSLDKKSVNETIGFIEAKEMAIRQSAVKTSVSLFQFLKKTTQRPRDKTTCCICDKLTNKFVWSS